MIDTLTRNWGWVALRGVVALLFGIVTLFYPGITILTLVLWFGAYAFVDGVFMIASALVHRHGEPRWLTLLVGGLVGIAAGVITFMNPAITLVLFLALVAGWAIVTGFAEAAAAIRLRKEISGEWLFIVAGLLAIALGVTLMLRPGAGALVLAAWLAVYAVVAGILLIALAFRLRHWGRTHPGGGTPHPA